MSTLQVPLALALAAVAPISSARPDWDAPPTPVPAGTVVAQGAPTRLAQSTGNLYWTYNSTTSNGRSHSVVYRTSKSARPGQERPLHTLDAVDHQFGAVTFARVDGAWRFYVVVNDLRNKRSSIRQVPGSGRVIINSPRPIGVRDLVTNGRHLFWADAGGVRRASVNGGGLTTLYPATNISRIGLAGNYLYVAQDNQIVRTDLQGRHRTRLISGPTAPVTAMHVHRSTVLYGLRDGTVQARTGLTAPVTYQPPQRDLRVTSVSFDGAKALWSDCFRSTETNCWIHHQGDPMSFPSGNEVHDLQGDQRAAYYATNMSVQRHAR